MRGVCHFSTKLVAMATSFKISGKEVRIDHLHTLSFVEKVAKIDPADPEVIVLQAVIKKRKKLTQAKYIAESESVPSGLKCIKLACECI